MIRVLVAEDDPAILRGLTDNLRRQGYEVDAASDGESALALAQSQQFDALVVDVMLPRMSGFELCQRLREEGNRVPILLLTARSEERDRVYGLDIGADDYITKPFSLLELMARVRALIRRSKGDAALPDRATFDDVAVDFLRYEATRGGSPLKLTPKEFGTLRFLIARSGKAVSRNELLEEVWDYRDYPTTRTIDNHISSLRNKIESDPSHPRHLLTVHGIGYRFVP
jgi:DNA-binding response OmpR family regulator